LLRTLLPTSTPNWPIYNLSWARPLRKCK
jgi:hypothetical protein